VAIPIAVAPADANPYPTHALEDRTDQSEEVFDRDTAYVLCLLVVLTVEQLAGRLRTGRAGILSLLVVLTMPLVDMALCRLLGRRARRIQPDGVARSGASFLPVLQRGIHIVVTAAGVLVIARLWNLDLAGMATRGVGARVGGALIDIGLTVMLAYLVWQLAKTAIVSLVDDQHPIQTLVPHRSDPPLRERVSPAAPLPVSGAVSPQSTHAPICMQPDGRMELLRPTGVAAPQLGRAHPSSPTRTPSRSTNPLAGSLPKPLGQSDDSLPSTARMGHARMWYEGCTPRGDMELSRDYDSNIVASLEHRILKRLQETRRVAGDHLWFVVRPEIFAIPFLDGFLLYSPLQGLLLLITRAGFASLLLNESLSISECLQDCVTEPDRELVVLFDRHPRQQPKVGSLPAAAFLPTSLMLSPTAACQLACTYCYIRGGDNPRNMPWEIAEVAIRFTTANARHAGKTRFDLELHGQGEPTANWPLFSDAIRLTEAQCAGYGLEPRVSVVTNGILTKAKIAFLAQHKVRVGLSFDALKPSMDRQRPMRNGESSFDRVMDTIRTFDDMGVPFAIRSTVTPLTVDELEEFVALLLEHTSCRYINFEPVCSEGRAADGGLDDSALIPRFVDAFRKASDFGIRHGVQVAFSTTRVDGLRSSFCGAYGADLNFCVSTEGLVSSCYEVLEATDPRAAIFVYGKYDRYSRMFRFNYERLQGLLDLNVTQIQRCQNCFAKWNCGGDCLSKAALGGLEHIKSAIPLERCVATRAFTSTELFQTLFRQRTPS
jgi:uncharacterized protein